MKRIIAIILFTVFLFSFAGCSKNSEYSELEEACEFMRTLLGTDVSTAKAKIEEKFGAELILKYDSEELGIPPESANNLILFDHAELQYTAFVDVGKASFDTISLKYIVTNGEIYDVSFDNYTGSAEAIRGVYQDCSLGLNSLFGEQKPYSSSNYNSESRTYRPEKDTTYVTYSFGTFSGIECYNPYDGYHSDVFKN